MDTMGGLPCVLFRLVVLEHAQALRDERCLTLRKDTKTLFRYNGMARPSL